MGLKVETAAQPVAAGRCRNRTKVGLKASLGTLAIVNANPRRNRTKVGLKDDFGVGDGGILNSRNRTKVGLKGMTLVCGGRR